MSRLRISDDVRALLPTSVVERVIAARQHTDIICPACRITITPEDPSIVSVSVAVDPRSDHMRLVLAHETCQPSIVIPAQLPDDIDWRFSYRMFLRDDASVRCVLVWEPVTTAVLPDATSTVNVTFYARQGFVASPDGVRYTHPAVLPGWTLRNRAEDLVLHSPAGEAEDFTLVLDGDPERTAWLDIARSSGHCLLIVGESLGLDHPDLDRIDALLADGRAVTAIVVTAIS